jgi:hypothetical protein
MFRHAPREGTGESGELVGELLMARHDGAHQLASI